MSIEGPPSINKSFGDLSDEPIQTFKEKTVGVQAKGLPPWMQAERISNMEILEIVFYKAITYIPVCITFGLYTFLATFYIFVSSIKSSTRFCL